MYDQREYMMIIPVFCLSYSLQALK